LEQSTDNSGHTSLPSFAQSCPFPPIFALFLLFFPIDKPDSSLKRQTAPKTQRTLIEGGIEEKKQQTAVSQKTEIRLPSNNKQEKGKRNDYLTSSRFFQRRFLLWHLRHFNAVAALREPQSLQIFMCNRAFCAIDFFKGSNIGI
jgi:hypothetical protein